MKSNKKGFGLIELMIVVAIVSILVAMLSLKFEEVNACSGGKQYSSQCLQIRNRSRILAPTQDVPATIVINGHTYVQQN